MSNIDRTHEHILLNMLEQALPGHSLTAETRLGDIHTSGDVRTLFREVASRTFRNYDIPALTDFNNDHTVQNVVFTVVQRIAQQRRERVSAHLAGRPIRHAQASHLWRKGIWHRLALWLPILRLR